MTCAFANLPSKPLTGAATPLPGITQGTIRLPAFGAMVHLGGMFLTKKQLTALTLNRAGRADWLVALIAAHEQFRTHLQPATVADAEMPLTDHRVARLAFGHVMHAEHLPANIAGKTAIYAHLLAAKGAGGRIRLADVPVAARARDDARQADPFLTDLASQDMQRIDRASAFLAPDRAFRAKRLATAHAS